MHAPHHPIRGHITCAGRGSDGGAPHAQNGSTAFGLVCRRLRNFRP